MVWPHWLLRISLPEWPGSGSLPECGVASLSLWGSWVGCFVLLLLLRLLLLLLLLPLHSFHVCHILGGSTPTVCLYAKILVCVHTSSKRMMMMMMMMKAVYIGQAGQAIQTLGSSRRLLARTEFQLASSIQMLPTPPCAAVTTVFSRPRPGPALPLAWPCLCRRCYVLFRFLFFFPCRHRYRVAWVHRKYRQISISLSLSLSLSLC